MANLDGLRDTCVMKPAERDMTFRDTIVLLVMISMGSAFGIGQTRWRQQEFVLGTYWDPPIDIRAKDFSKDVASFKLAKDAYFNLLTGTQGDGMIDRSFNGMVYSLRVASAAGIHYLVTDNRMGVGYDKEYERTLAHSIVKDYQALPKELRAAQYGYDLCDEPQYKSDHLRNVSDWKWSLESADPEKLVFLNLVPSYGVDQNWGGFSSGNQNGLSEKNERKEYEAYLRYYVDSLKPQVISFDHYPFFKDGSFRPDYFYNLDVIRKKADGRPFWACPMTVDHYDYVDPTEEHLNFMYFCPIAYGAKGLTVFSFWPLPYDGYRSSLFDQKGYKTTRYDIVRRINMYVSLVVGPVVLDLPNVEVYHSAVFPDNQVGIEGTVNQKSSYIHSITDPHVLVGVFKGSKECYLFVVNKGLRRIENVRIAVAGREKQVFFSPRIFGFDETTLLEYKNVPTDSVSRRAFAFVIPELNGGEGRLVRIGN